MPGNADELCKMGSSTRVILDQITDKWSMAILAVICEEPRRFNEIRRMIEGITQKALTQTLRRLERNGLVARRVIPVSPIAVEYSMTPLGHTLREPFTVLFAWTMEHQDEVKKAQEAFDAGRSCETSSSGPRTTETSELA